MHITKDFVQSVRERLLREPGVSAAGLAQELGATEAQVITAFPVNMRKKARPEDFRAIWAELDGHVGGSLAGFCETELGQIWFVRRGDGQLESRFVEFFGKGGDKLLSIKLGGAQAQAVYTHLCERFGVVPVPKMGCKGCGKCTCGGKHKEHAH